MLGLYVFGEQDPTRLFYANRDLRVSGTLGATNGFAGYMAMLLVTVLPFMFRERNLLRYVVYGAGMIALLVTFSRAGWLSFICGVLLVTLVMVRARVIRVTRIMMLGALIVLFLGVGVNFYFEGVQERFMDRTAIGAAEGRVTQFSQMWPAIERHPLFGIGPGVTEYFGAWNDNVKYVRGKLPGVQLGNQPHNSQLQIWVESGTPAFILFVIILIMILRGALTRPEINREGGQLLYLRIGAAGGAAVAMIDASFGPEINSYQISLVFWILLGVSRSRAQARVRQKSEPAVDDSETESERREIGRGSSPDPLLCK
jgi:O-antigen ligase